MNEDERDDAAFGSLARGGGRESGVGGRGRREWRRAVTAGAKGILMVSSGSWFRQLRYRRRQVPALRERERHPGERHTRRVIETGRERDGDGGRGGEKDGGREGRREGETERMRQGETEKERGEEEREWEVKKSEREDVTLTLRYERVRHQV